MSKKTSILLVEDDLNLGNLLREYLNAKGFHAELQSNGEEGYKAFMRQQFDICILDVMMPVKDGFTLAKEIRMINNEIPIIFLTAKSMKEDVFEGFEKGADDYITKPFNMQELIYRIEAVLRRTQNSGTKPMEGTIKIGKYQYDTFKQQLKFGKEKMKLTTTESELLKILAMNLNKVVERNYVLETIWGDDSYFKARSMDVYITKLRKYLKKDQAIEIINVHGKGYKLIVTSESAV